VRLAEMLASDVCWQLAGVHLSVWAQGDARRSSVLFVADVVGALLQQMLSSGARKC